MKPRTSFLALVLFLNIGYGLMVVEPWGASVTITNALVEHLTGIALQKLEAEIGKMSIPPYDGKVAGGTLKVKDATVKDLKMPKLGITFENPSVIAVRTTAGRLEASTWFSFKHWISSVEGNLNVAASGFDVEIMFQARSNELGNIVLKKADSQGCDVTINGLQITSSGKGVLLKLEKLLNGAVESVARKQLSSFICSTIDSMFERFSNASHEIILPNASLPLGVDLKLMSSPFIGDGFLRTQVLAQIFSTNNAKSKLDPPLIPLPPLPKKMFQALISEYSIDSLLRTVTQQYQTEGFTLESTEKQPLTFLKTTCPGTIPLCVGRLLRTAGKRHPNSTVSVLAKPFGYPHCSITPAGVNVTGGLSFEFTVTDPTGAKFTSTLSLKFGIIVGRVFMNNGNILIRNLALEKLSGRLLGTDDGSLISEKDIARLENILKPVLKFYAEDWLLESKIDPVKGFPVKLVNPEIQLCDGAMMFESDFDLSSLLTDGSLNLLPASLTENH